MRKLVCKHWISITSWSPVWIWIAISPPCWCLIHAFNEPSDSIREQARRLGNVPITCRGIKSFDTRVSNRKLISNGFILSPNEYEHGIRDSNVFCQFGDGEHCSLQKGFVQETWWACINIKWIYIKCEWRCDYNHTHICLVSFLRSDKGRMPGSTQSKIDIWILWKLGGFSCQLNVPQFHIIRRPDS